jgi:CrcB protein
VTALLVAVGALVGAPLRLLATSIAGRNGRDPAAGTLVVNVVGSAVLGALLGLAAAPPALVALVGTGFCGTFTTFSTFGLEERRFGRALAYLVASLVLGLGAAAGTWLAAGAVR